MERNEIKMDEEVLLTVFSPHDIAIVKAWLRLTKTTFTKEVVSCFASYAIYIDDTNALRFLIDRNVKLSTYTPFVSNYSFNNCQRLLLDRGLPTYLLRPRLNDKANQFCASRKRARKGAIAIMHALRMGKDIGRIIARVVWESRGFYLLVKRK